MTYSSSASAGDTSSTTTALHIFMQYVCPSLGCIISLIMFAAPIKDLSRALTTSKSLGFLNPFPWAVMTANCFGWICYGYYVHDPFVLASNIPGLFVSLWLNMGAIKLQYMELASTTTATTTTTSSSRKHQRRQQQQQATTTTATNATFRDATDVAAATAVAAAAANQRRRNRNSRMIEIDEDGNARIGILSSQHTLLEEDLVTPVLGAIRNSENNERNGESNDDDDDDDDANQARYESVMKVVPQERILFRLLFLWLLVLLWVGWIPAIGGLEKPDPAHIIGILVNINLIFFYAAPLQAIWTVLQTRSSQGLHLPTMLLNTLNSSFWMAYGVAQHNPVILVPNVLGFAMGILQGLLCLVFPRNTVDNIDAINDDNNNDDVDVDVFHRVDDDTIHPNLTRSGKGGGEIITGGPNNQQQEDRNPDSSSKKYDPPDFQIV